MEVKELINNANNGEITAYIGSFNIEQGLVLPKFNNENITVVDYFSSICTQDKLIKALPVLEIKEDVLTLKITELSNSLKNKLAVVEALVSKEDVFIFDNVHKSLAYREIQNIKRILKKMSEYNKKVIVITNDVEFLFDLTKKVYGIKNDVMNKLSPIDWFNDEVYNYASKPPIIEFVMNLKNRNIKIDNCYETKELLKAIYRSVGK